MVRTRSEEAAVISATAEGRIGKARSEQIRTTLKAVAPDHMHRFGHRRAVETGMCML